MAREQGQHDLSDGDHRAVAAEMHDRWKDGESKSQLEIEYWDDATSHGKAFTAYVKKWVGVSTERRSSQSLRIEYLEGLLRAQGVSPSAAGDLAEEYRLLAKARESALAAIRVYNDPQAGFRTETFILLMVIGWNSLLQAMLERDDVDYYARNEDGKQELIDGRARVKGTWELAELAIGGDDLAAIRWNLDFFLGLRNAIAHRYLPALDVAITGEAQAMLLNFERLLVSEFGQTAALGESLAVPLQLSGFRSREAATSLRQAQSQLPVDVSSFLARHREDVSDEVLASEEYCLQIFFVPVSANRERAADATVRFIQADQVTGTLADQLRELGVVTKRRRVPVASGDLLRSTEVANLVAERLPYRFTVDTHTRAWKHYQVRPPTGAGEPEATDDRYCRWDRLLNGYGYTKAWVEKLVRDLSDAGRYATVIGFNPERR